MDRLTFGILAWSVDVVGPYDNGLELIAGCDKHLGCGFASPVWVRGGEGILLDITAGAGLCGAIGLVRRHVDELLDAVGFCAFQHDLRAMDVCVGRSKRIGEAGAHV